jgi:hypothetical protein
MEILQGEVGLKRTFIILNTITEKDLEFSFLAVYILTNI